MPTPDKNTLKFNSNEKSLHMPYIIYADLEVIFRKIQSCQPNSENSYTEKKNVHIPSGYALHLLRKYDENLISSYRGIDCMQKFARAIKIMAKMIINTPQKEMIPLNDEEKHSYSKSKYYHICKKKFSSDKSNKNYHKVRDHDHYTGKYRGAAHSICNLQHKVPKDIPVVFHNGSKYDYHFIIRELAKGINGIECLGEDVEKYITFKVPLKKENEDGKLITCKLKLIDSIRFMDRSLSDLTDNLSELNKQECKKCKEKCKYITNKNNVLIYRCTKCNSKS